MARAAKATTAVNANIAVQALGLLGRWQRICNGHLAFTAGCACSYGGSIDLSEFDELILDFLLNKFAHDAAIAAFVAQRASAVPGQPGRLAVLLKALAVPSTSAGAADLAPERVQAVLQALEGSITSIEEQHTA